MKPFPKIQDNTLNDVIKIIEYMQKERRNDVADFDNLKNRFISGRKTGKIPTGSADVSDTDRLGDFAYDASYLYLLIDNGGTAEWRRVALTSW